MTTPTAAARFSLLLTSCLALAGCPSATVDAAGPGGPAPAATGDAPVPMPEECKASVAGHYHHAEDPTFRYDVTDDGTEAVVTTYRLNGAQREDLPADSGGVIALHRSLNGFWGTSKSIATTVEGQACEVEFPYEVVACSAAGLTLRTMHEFGLRADCSAEEDATPAMEENHLVRDDGAAPAAAPAAPAK